jgi:hypothetical protein
MEKSLPKSVTVQDSQRLDRLSGLGTHFVTAALHSTGASNRLSVVTLRIRRYTCNGKQGSVTGTWAPGDAPARA